jgi:chemotaxis response regulator CheB
MRIGIVNDSAMAVEVMRRTIERNSPHCIAWVARNGAEAVQSCARDRPDLILMDLVMPVLDGVEATRQIMTTSPCAILIVTASVNGLAGKVFEALGAGALDAVSTPALGAPPGAAELLSKIRMLDRLINSDRPRRKQHAAPAPRNGGDTDLIVIGASAGGPAALATIFSTLPRGLPAAVVVVQHVDAQFAPSMAEWLHHQSALPVRVAVDGDRPTPGEILLAGRDEHLVFKDASTLTYTPEPSDHSSCPSIDVFFQTVLTQWKGKVIAVLLTGMGRDGAKGMAALRKSGAMTIAQDRATSIVYGMPKAAVELGAAARVLPLDAISPALVQLVNGSSARA